MQIGFRLCEGVLRSNRETEWMFILRTMYPCGLNRKGGGGGAGVEALLKMIKIQSGLKVIMAL